MINLYVNQLDMSLEINLKKHWNNAYTSKAFDKLGWFESDVSATFKLLEKSAIETTDRVLNVGAGSTTLIDELLAQGYSNVIASDLSDVSLEKLKERLGDKREEVEWIVDDLTKSTKLCELEPVDIWIDRAVLHFFTEESDRLQYFELLKKLVKTNGYAIFAEFSLDGAVKCSGLDVHRYSNDLFKDNLGDTFELIDTFNFSYTMPSGDPRPFIYSLFKRVK